jgi:hypothetical protein
LRKSQLACDVEKRAYYDRDLHFKRGGGIRFVIFSLEI